jgi:hypothetical protein
MRRASRSFWKIGLLFLETSGETGGASQWHRSLMLSTAALVQPQPAIAALQLQQVAVLVWMGAVVWGCPVCDLIAASSEYSSVPDDVQQRLQSFVYQGPLLVLVDMRWNLETPLDWKGP